MSLRPHDPPSYAPFSASVVNTESRQEASLGRLGRSADGLKAAVDWPKIRTILILLNSAAVISHQVRR